MSFETLGLAEPILRAVRDTGYTKPTPIQTKGIPPVLAGRDVLGCAQTGTGKTAAFTLPILHRLAAQGAPRSHHRPIRCLVLSPTRELAAQIGESVVTYGRHLPLVSTVIFGGVGQHPQEKALRRGVDILVATPGRLLDLMNQGLVSLREVSVFVLDEADRMLDMGFINDIRKVLAVLPKQRQTLFFSATMPKEIRGLADQILTQPVTVEVAPVSSAAETVEQRIYHVEKSFKQELLAGILADQNLRRALIFTRTKHGADKVARSLHQGGVNAEAIHGNKSQNQRLRTLAGFKSGSIRVLVASDIAARGLDIDDIDLVVNFDVPNEPETYVHRIGRTGRAGATGRAVSFCSGDERPFLRDIEKLIRREVPVVEDHPFVGKRGPPSAPGASRGDRPQGQRHGGGRPGFGGGRQGHGGGRPEQRRDSRRDGQGAGRPAAQGSGEGQGSGTGVRDVQRPRFVRRGRPEAPRW